MTVQIAMVLAHGEPEIALPALLGELAARWPDLPAATEVGDEGGSILFKLGDSLVAISAMPAPVPWSDLEGPCATSLLWRDAAGAVRAHDRHVLVSVLGDAPPLAAAGLLTRVTAAVMAVAPQAIGVYWCNATLVAPRNLFIDFASKVLPLGPPLPIWVDIRVGWNADQSASRGFTTGLAALGLMDIESTTATEPPAQLRQRFEGIATYLLEKGLVIRDGDTLGETADEKLRIVYGPSSFGAEGPVMQLTYGVPRPAPATPGAARAARFTAARKP